MTKPTFENNTRTTYDSDSATRKLNMETTIEIRYEFVKILQDNAFNGIDGTDVVNHIAKDAIRRILGFGIRRIDYLYRPCCKEIDDMVYFEKTCVELVRAILTSRQHTFAQELKLENHPEQHIRGDAIRRILGFGIRRIDYLYRPCCKEIDDMVYFESRLCCVELVSGQFLTRSSTTFASKNSKLEIHP
ncbi:hypothetical protein Tco_1468522 [Tanacetum coccineum]